MFTHPVKRQLFSTTSLSPSPALPFHFHFDSRQVWILMSSISHLETYLDDCHFLEKSEDAGNADCEIIKDVHFINLVSLISYWCRIGHMKYWATCWNWLWPLLIILTVLKHWVHRIMFFHTVCGQWVFP